MNNDFTHEELYPHIVVYKNVFEDIDKMFDILKKSENEKTNFFEWSQWSRFGNYITSYPIDINIHSLNFEIIKDYLPENSLEDDQRYFLLELIQSLFLANKHYLLKYNINIDTNELVNLNNENVHRWKWEKPNICVYNQTNANESKAMNYHSDYIREPITSPGYKFTLTTLAYFNDDYKKGGLDFAVGKKLIGYKPSKGDIVVFPSGHPDFLTFEDNIYLHGVDPIVGNKKYFARSYWMRYSEGDKEWHDKENLYGKEVWNSMQEEIMREFREKNPQKNSIHGGVRIK